MVCDFSLQFQSSILFCHIYISVTFLNFLIFFQIKNILFVAYIVCDFFLQFQFSILFCHTYISVTFLNILNKILG